MMSTMALHAHRWSVSHGKIECIAPDPPRLTFGEARGLGLGSRRDVDNEPAERGADGDRPGGHQGRLAGAQKGYKLLKKKADALGMAVPSDPPAHLGRQEDNGRTMWNNRVFADAGQVRAGDGIKYTIEDTVGTSSNVRVRSHVDNVAGVKPALDARLLAGTTSVPRT